MGETPAHLKLQQLSGNRGLMSKRRSTGAATPTPTTKAPVRTACRRLDTQCSCSDGRSADVRGNLNAGFTSASANCEAVANRSAGILANARCTAAATLAGTSPVSS